MASLLRTRSDALPAALQVINNILTSGHNVMLARIHRCLGLFCAHLEPKYNKTEDQLLEYLDILVTKGHLKCEGAKYSFAVPK